MTNRDSDAREVRQAIQHAEFVLSNSRALTEGVIATAHCTLADAALDTALAHLELAALASQAYEER